MKIAPDLKEKSGFVAKIFINWASFSCQNFNFSKKMGVLGDRTQFCEKNKGSCKIVKYMGSLGEGNAKNGGLNSLTYVSLPERECPPHELNDHETSPYNS